MPLYPPSDLARYRHELHALPLAFVLEAREFYCWELAELETAIAVEWFDASTAFVRFKLTELTREVERRETLRSHPQTPDWRSPPPDRKRQWEAVREALSLPALIETLVPHVAWIRSGHTLKARCPFGIHPDTNPSFTVYPSQDSFHCFGCGIGGTIFDFVMALCQFDFLEALDALADLAGITAPGPVATGPTGRSDMIPVVIKRGGKEQHL